MNIDWDDVAEQAEASPRLTLTEVMEVVDDMQMLAVVWLDGEDVVRARYVWGQGDSLRMLGLLDTVKHSLLNQQADTLR